MIIFKIPNTTNEIVIHDIRLGNGATDYIKVFHNLDGAHNEFTIRRMNCTKRFEKLIYADQYTYALSKDIELYL